MGTQKGIIEDDRRGGKKKWAKSVPQPKIRSKRGKGVQRSFTNPEIQNRSGRSEEGPGGNRVKGKKRLVERLLEENMAKNSAAETPKRALDKP